MLKNKQSYWFSLFFFFFPFIQLNAQHAKIAPPAPVLPVPKKAQLAWHQMETNAFIHFSTNTFTGKEWGYGDESPSLFNPAALDAGQWAKTLKECGFKMMILTCKHHDGFCLWPSKYTSHSVKNSPYKNGNGDVVKEASNAAKKYGLRFGIYLSPWDRNHADYGTPRYIDYYRKQLQELFTQYGSIAEMWFDGANGGDGFYGGARETRKIDGSLYYEWPKTISLIKKWNPDVIFFSDAGPSVRWVGNERGVAGETNWNTISPDTLFAGKPGIENLLNTGSEDGTQWIPAETDVSIRPGWFYHEAEDSLVKSPEKLFEIYLNSVGRGSTLLLNIPPDGRGLFHEQDIKALKGFKQILRRELGNNLAQHATIKASNFRGNKKKYAPVNLIDNSTNSYWATDDGITTASIELKLPTGKMVKYILLQEFIALGQRVKSFEVEAWKNGQWTKIAGATTIGYKRILKIEPLFTKKIRIHIRSSKACPVLSNIAFY
ncbi:MAG: alpha-L-fucosidase [Ferruginibacter sp.]